MVASLRPRTSPLGETGEGFFGGNGKNMGFGGKMGENGGKWGKTGWQYLSAKALCVQVEYRIGCQWRNQMVGDESMVKPLINLLLMDSVIYIYIYIFL